MTTARFLTLLTCLIATVHPFQLSVNVNKHVSSSNAMRNPFRHSTEMLAKKKGSKLISDDFLSSLDQFDETPAATKAAVAETVASKTIEVEKEREVFIDVASVEVKAEGEDADAVKKKKKKRDKSKKDYFSNVDLGDAKDEEAGEWPHFSCEQ